MIKNLLDADEELPSKEKNTVENIVDKQAEEQPFSTPQMVEEQSSIVEKQAAFEIPEDASFFNKESETGEVIPQSFPTGENILEEENFSEESIIPETFVEKTPLTEFTSPEAETVAAENPFESIENETALMQIQPSEFKLPSKAETIRQSGLAWSAGVIFFGSIVFMLILGWFADLLLGTSPWGIVLGIVLGSIIGFIQFFRITSQIFKNK